MVIFDWWLCWNWCLVLRFLALSSFGVTGWGGLSNISPPRVPVTPLPHMGMHLINFPWFMGFLLESHELQEIYGMHAPYKVEGLMNGRGVPTWYTSYLKDFDFTNMNIILFWLWSEFRKYFHCLVSHKECMQTEYFLNTYSIVIKKVSCGPYFYFYIQHSRSNNHVSNFGDNY